MVVLSASIGVLLVVGMVGVTAHQRSPVRAPQSGSSCSRAGPASRTGASPGVCR
jgi:hypothetical protein